MMRHTRRTWLQTMLGAFTSLSLSSCASSDVDDFDVCVVGSGPAGAILAAELVRQNIRTVLLEGGLVLSRRSVEQSDQDILLSETSPIVYPVDVTRFTGDGGTSNLWEGRCPRFQPFDFSAKNTYIPPGHRWPFTYEEIEPFYARAERALSIGGAATTKYSPPRSSGFAFSPVTTAVPTCLIPLLSQHGWSAEVCPESHAKRVAETHLPSVASSSSGRFVRDAKVVSIEMNSDGSVAGLTARSPDGASRTFRARVYVLAMGGVETARLLLLSRPPQYLRGIGNASDLVGRYFTEHLGVPLGTFTMPANRVCSPTGVEQAISWQFYEEFKRQGLGGVILEFTLDLQESVLSMSAVFEMKPSPSNRVVLSARDVDTFGLPLAEVTVTISDDERRTWDRLKTIGPKIAASMGLRAQSLNVDDGGWCHHHMGTCRMGDDPRTSVVDSQLRVHGVSNLYVSGSSTFVTTGVGSPTLLLSALTLRLADHLVAQTRTR